jgi:hypothetical protein
MSNSFQRLQLQAIPAGVSIQQLPTAFAAHARESLLRRDDATLSVQTD